MNQSVFSKALHALTCFIRSTKRAAVGMTLSVALVAGCASTAGSTGTVGSGSGSATSSGGGAGSTFLQCGKEDLLQLVHNVPLLTTVAADLLSLNFIALLSELIGVVGKDAVGCAVLAVQAVDTSQSVATTATAGSGSSTVPAVAHAVSTRVVHANEAIEKFGWKVDPATSATGK